MPVEGKIQRSKTIRNWFGSAPTWLNVGANLNDYYLIHHYYSRGRYTIRMYTTLALLKNCFDGSLAKDLIELMKSRGAGDIEWDGLDPEVDRVATEEMSRLVYGQSRRCPLVLLRKACNAPGPPSVAEAELPTEDGYFVHMQLEDITSSVPI
jgi:hypothetical protein